MWQRSKDDAAMESAMGQLASDDATVGQSAQARWQQTIGQLVSLPGTSQQGTADKASASDLAGKDDAAVGQSARARQELTRWQAVSRQHPGPAGQQKQRSSSSRHSYRRARKHAARKQLKTRLSNEEALLTG